MVKTKGNAETQESCVEVTSFLISFGSIQSPTREDIEMAVQLRAMGHAALGQMVHTKLRKFIEQHGTEEDLEQAQRIAQQVKEENPRFKKT